MSSRRTSVEILQQDREFSKKYSTAGQKIQQETSARHVAQQARECSKTGLSSSYKSVGQRVQQKGETDRSVNKLEILQQARVQQDI